MKPLILFDIDGTLADTFDTVMKLATKFAPQYNIPLVPPKRLKELRGMATKEIIRALEIPWYKLPFFIRKIRTALNAEMHTIKAFPGTVALVRQLHKQGYLLGIISSNSHANVNLFLNVNKFPPFHITHTGLGMFAKPRILRTIARTHPSLVYIGDETRDIDAAHQADVPVIAVSWGYSSPEGLKKHTPTALVKTPKALLSAIKRIV